MRAFTAAHLDTQNRMVYLQNLGASFVSSSFYTRLALYLSHIFGLDNIAIRGIPGAGSRRSYVFFMVLQRLRLRWCRHCSRTTGRCDCVPAGRLGRGLRQVTEAPSSPFEEEKV
jgi:hypothetical protein